ncbi:MAG: CoA transferase, partial [Desulfatiglandales bacterium]|nr:CoA transferase [Desulfatiglandales bacterium]
MDKLNPQAPFTVLDLTDQKGWMCGKVLSELGAEVIKIEPPGGDPGRNTGPFFHNTPDPERCLNWFAYNSNKKGITLNIESQRGRDILTQLVKRADIVLESFSPGYLESCGLSYLQLRQLNSRIVLTSISSFGQTGPYKKYKSCDLIAMAMGGFAYVCGDADRAPVRISIDQANANAGVHAAAGSLMGHRLQKLNGEGRWIDISIQECITRALYVELAYWDALGEVPVRTGPRRRRMASYLRDLWPCKDGHLGFRILGGRLGAGTLKALSQWMESEGMAGMLKDYDF